ncbi:MAG: hypothetical protein QM718_02350 [Steroidobacteraceae bacterium]
MTTHKHAIAALILALIASMLMLPRANAAVALDLRAGTLGAGADLNVSLTASLAARVGFSAFSRTETVDDTDATYDGKLKLGNASALLDWYPGGHFLRLSAGAVATGNKVNITAVPVNGIYSFDGNTYSSDQIDSAVGHIKTGSSLAPYVGFGFGNPLSGHHFHVMLDVGVMLTGKPKVSLDVVCDSSLTNSECAQVQQAARGEIADLQDKADDLKVWPVLNFGIAYRF